MIAVDSYPCPTCSQFREIKFSINGKPYLVCNSCGVQLFIRGKNGIKKLEENHSQIIKIKKPDISSIYNLIEIQKELEIIRTELIRIQNIENEKELSRDEKRLKRRLIRKEKFLNSEFSELISDS